MADTIKSSNELKIDMGFYDGDTRMLTYDNPKAGLSAKDIHDFEDFMISKQPLLGDKGGAQFVGFKSAKVCEKTKVILDI